MESRAHLALTHSHADAIESTCESCSWQSNSCAHRHAAGLGAVGSFVLLSVALLSMPTELDESHVGVSALAAHLALDRSKHIFATHIASCQEDWGLDNAIDVLGERSLKISTLRSGKLENTILCKGSQHMNRLSTKTSMKTGSSISVHPRASFRQNSAHRAYMPVAAGFISGSRMQAGLKPLLNSVHNTQVHEAKARVLPHAVGEGGETGWRKESSNITVMVNGLP
eukprot:gnl/TRDRNA2_/TRDRNA2_157790_c0_seq1.p1 gnl/TRDRNA2_/TRDRNA2_157790_c0~~gnl/TRDRNA2_/TRDRNA2_157790_c0_seq1.p1  ORF type:complete len:226 (-),score=13.76 gnl/TRDRNA2_/TRDRNA2_157790_c0_seq1:133-810(-)